MLALMRRKRRMPIKVNLLFWASLRVGCCVKSILYCTYLKAQQAFLCCLISTWNMREKSTKMFRMEAERIIANKSAMEADSPNYLACFDSYSFCIGINTFCTQTLSGNKNQFQDLQLYNRKSVTGIAGGLEITGEGTIVFQMKMALAKLIPSEYFCSFCAWSELTLFFSSALDGDS